MEHLESPDRPTELVLSVKPRSPSSIHSSPFSSTVSDNELEGSFASRPPSCSSSQQNSLASSSIQSKLFMNTRSSSNSEKTCSSDSKIFDKLGAIRSRRNGNDGDSDEETMDEDSNCSSNEISNISFANGLSNSKRNSGGTNEVPWRSPHDSAYASGDGGRKLSFTGSSFRKTTPSPCTSGRSSPIPRVVCAAAPRSRIASIRRESNCSVETEAAHEKLVKTAQQVSATFDDISIADGERKRTHSLSEPISILTNAFLPHSCSPSPTRPAEIQKQCYSPSTQQIVRNNITYSPSPSPTPSPTRRIMRSLSPIVSRQVTKRRYTGSSGIDGEGDSILSTKRVCQAPLLNYNSCTQPVYERNIAFSLPCGEASSTSTLDSVSISFCIPRPPLKASSENSAEKQKSDQAITAMDSDDCSSVTGGEEFVRELFSTNHTLQETKTDSSESMSSGQEDSTNGKDSANITSVTTDSTQNGR